MTFDVSKWNQEFDDLCDKAWGISDYLKPAKELTEEQNRTWDMLKQFALEHKFDVWLPKGLNGDSQYDSKSESLKTEDGKVGCEPQG